ncbi:MULTISPECIES: FIST signal transduction protein [unclassified Thiocapsa]|uniref:FIST signal transduction protein n=1 Tax=unclassified Thiocapsa TaxID=2641286 RepID=UPI0035B21C67
MQIEMFDYRPADGWGIETFPAMDSEQTLVLAFGDSAFLDDPAPFAALRSAYPKARLMGCSTAGEIRDTQVQDGTLVVAVARFEDTRLETAVVPAGLSNRSRETGIALAEQLAAPDLKGILVLSDGLHVNGSQLVDGLNAVLKGSVIVTGGLAGDGDRFQRTWVLDQDRPVELTVAALGLYGERVRIGHGSRGGWDIFGPERRVTRAAGNQLFELDGRPALQLYKEYLGELASGLPATALRFPLALRADAGDEKRLVRTILAVDEEDGSMTFAGDIPEGSLAQLMRTNLDHLVDGAEDAALMTRNSGSNGERTLAIAISCVGRRMVLGERADEEVEATLEALPPGTRQVGFYSYGEIAPYASGACDLHNQTMTLTTIHEV